MDDFDMPSTPSPSTNGSGILRTKIQLGRKPSVIMPFHLMRPELPATAPITGRDNLLSTYGLDHAWSRFCGSKKLKEELSSFLPHLPGNIDLPCSVDGSSLKSLVEKPPITGKEIVPLSSAALTGFKLQPGSIPEHLKPAGYGTIGEKKRHKRKHEKLLLDEIPSSESANNALTVSTNQNAAPTFVPPLSAAPLDRPAKRAKKDEDRDSSKKKKKKKDKKKKKLDLADETGNNIMMTSSSILMTSSAANASSFSNVSRPGPSTNVATKPIEHAIDFSIF